MRENDECHRTVEPSTAKPANPSKPLRSRSDPAARIVPVADAAARAAAHKSRQARIVANLQAQAERIARAIAKRRGRVTSPEVQAKMKRLGYGPELNIHGKKVFNGRLFREGPCWHRIGWETTGSHGRPVPIWAPVFALLTDESAP